MFDLNGKVALVTGGASGIGYYSVKELLRNGVKGVAIADINIQNGQTIMQDLEREFGLNRAIFIPTDVANKDQFEDAFKKTIDAFNNMDILVNNAAIMNDASWEREISVNINGTINGCVLALDDYLKKYRQGEEGVVLNISSVAALSNTLVLPIYSATKRAVLGLTGCWGLDQQYQHSKVRFISVCPGGTDTPIMENCHTRTLGPFYQNIVEKILPILPKQSPEHVAKAIVEIIVKGKNGSIWVVERNEPAYEVEIPPLEKLRK